MGEIMLNDEAKWGRSVSPILKRQVPWNFEINSVVARQIEELKAQVPAANREKIRALFVELGAITVTEKQQLEHALIYCEVLLSEMEKDADGQVFPLVTLNICLELHRLVGSGTIRASGILRTTEVGTAGPAGEFTMYIGPEHVASALEALIDQVNESQIVAGDDLVTRMKCAAVFFQEFERVHPFVDGNGRVGRLLFAFLLYPLLKFPALVYQRGAGERLRHLRYVPLQSPGQLFSHIVETNLLITKETEGCDASAGQAERACSDSTATSSSFSSSNRSAATMTGSREARGAMSSSFSSSATGTGSREGRTSTNVEKRLERAREIVENEDKQHVDARRGREGRGDQSPGTFCWRAGKYRERSKKLLHKLKFTKLTSKLWHGAGQRCPIGSIPIRRTLDADLQRLIQRRQENRSGDRFDFGFGRKSQGPPRVNNKKLEAAIPSNSRQHEHAIAYAEGVFYGAEAVINVWDPSVEGSDEFSLSQMWILAGTFNVDLNSVEAGWQVNPELYGDRNPRFFTYWTSDSYRGTGCYNLLCEGFVQINDQVVLGGTIAPVSSLNGAQYDIHVLVFKDFITGNWWLRYGDELIGYWPPQLFTHLASFANVIEWGGEVVDTRPSNRHTATQMGSGHYPQSGYAVASYLNNLRVVDFTSLLRGPPRISTLSTKPECYNIRSSGGNFFYGGPGLSSSCR